MIPEACVEDGLDGHPLQDAEPGLRQLGGGGEGDLNPALLSLQLKKSGGEGPSPKSYNVLVTRPRAEPGFLTP